MRPADLPRRQLVGLEGAGKGIYRLMATGGHAILVLGWPVRPAVPKEPATLTARPLRGPEQAGGLRA